MIVYTSALITVILFDALCIKFIFPRIFSSSISSDISFRESLIGAIIATFLLGIGLLSFVGGSLVVPLLEKNGFTEEQGVVIIKNLYYTFFPFSNALFLICWSKVSKKMRFIKFWPDALLAGIILHYIDIGIVVPWFFRTAEVFSRTP